MELPHKGILICILLPFTPLIMLSLPLLIPLFIVFYILYYLFGPIQPRQSPLRSVEIGSSSNSKESAKRRNYLFRKELITEPQPGVNTIPQQFQLAVEKYGNKHALGIRKTVKTVEKVTKATVDGQEVSKTLKIPYQTPYEWRTYNDCAAEIDSLVLGINHLFNLKPNLHMIK